MSEVIAIPETTQASPELLTLLGSLTTSYSYSPPIDRNAGTIDEKTLGNNTAQYEDSSNSWYYP